MSYTVENMAECRKHVTRTYEDHLPPVAVQYHPGGRRFLGRLKLRWKDQEKLEDQETGLNGPEPVSFLMIMIMNLRELETCLSAKNSPCGRKC